MLSIAKRQKTVEFYPFIRRLCDLTSPNMGAPCEERSENRYSRTIPTLLAPWAEGRPLLEESIIGITGNLADRGVAVVFNQPFRADEVVLGYWVSDEEPSQPWYFLGHIRRNQAIGGGFWLVGIELAEFANPTYSGALAPLKPLAKALLKPADPATMVG